MIRRPPRSTLFPYTTSSDLAAGCGTKRSETSPNRATTYQARRSEVRVAAVRSHSTRSASKPARRPAARRAARSDEGVVAGDVPDAPLPDGSGGSIGKSDHASASATRRSSRADEGVRRDGDERNSKGATGCPVTPLCFGAADRIRTGDVQLGKL